jgi:hypothetical protein
MAFLSFEETCCFLLLIIFLAPVAVLRCEETSHKHKKQDETPFLLLITLGNHNEREEKDGRVPRMDKRTRRVKCFVGNTL